ncbi:type II toxin-antitoxin system HigB family toxin [Salegentibacter maritimus]|uniref:Type II toxin-antitoxin system HigB family toxin n=1 Tax=Salegentibacter maritimus TaxID=2794347 RepID=A0ABS0TEZ6_9FLAO|nr:type II toxin-antitoxin system HigB family toxin [Salegentibacter maritimus]MBI6119632.1 type II toxin-antitoxin system HigB family toxin [Salegentibacter maritimus]
MRLINRKALEKLKRKKRGNASLAKEIDLLIEDFETHNWQSQEELKQDRKDADCVHSEGFYFFNIEIHRTMILIEFEDNEASVIWVGSHQEYERIFKNNKSAIANWLKSKDLI